MQMPDGLGGAIAFLIGAITGSFAPTVAYRMPRDLSILTPRSFCESCERAIPVWANVPILAYIGLRGRCVMCGATIPFRHFLTEVGLAIIALYLYFNFPLGDAIARLYEAAGFHVTREYYFNDHGAQIDRFARSLVAAAASSHCCRPRCKINSAAWMLSTRRRASGRRAASSSINPAPAMTAATAASSRMSQATASSAPIASTSGATRRAVWGRR